MKLHDYRHIIYEQMPYGKRKAYSRRRSANTTYRRRSLQSKTRTSSRKRYNRYKPTRGVSTFRPKWLNPLSQRQLVRFVYADSSFSRTLNIANGYSSYYVFRGNSIFDPDYTGFGAQPYGYDQLVNSTMYGYYRCPSSSICVYFRPEEDYKSISRLHAFVIPLINSAPVLSDISDVRMIPDHRATVYDGSTESTSGARLKNYMSTRRLIPYSPNDASFSASYNTNPNGVWNWIVLFYTDVFDDEEIDIYFDVKIKYYTSLTRSGQVPDES